MNNKKIFSFAVAAIFTALTVIVFQNTNMAQGRYAGQYSKRDVSNIITTLERSSNTFRRDFDRAMDNSSINGTSTEDRFNGIVRNYENSLDRLRRNYDRWDSWWESRSNVQDVLSRAQPVNTMMNELPFGRNLERQWREMRGDINKLADTYDLPGLDGGGWQGGGGGGSGNAPSWALGTFYTPDPQGGGTITLTIDRKGNVRSSLAGHTAYATMRGDTMYMDGVAFHVTKINNGIRTRRNDNGVTVNYSRTNPGGAGNPYAPSWAVGTFYTPDPQGGGIITLTIDRNGNVRSSLGSETGYATMYGDTMYMDGVAFRVTRINNGIRTRRIDNGVTVNYSRNPRLR